MLPIELKNLIISYAEHNNVGVAIDLVDQIYKTYKTYNLSPAEVREIFDEFDVPIQLEANYRYILSIYIDSSTVVNDFYLINLIASYADRLINFKKSDRNKLIAFLAKKFIKINRLLASYNLPYRLILDNEDDELTFTIFKGKKVL